MSFILEDDPRLTPHSAVDASDRPWLTTAFTQGVPLPQPVERVTLSVSRRPSDTIPDYFESTGNIPVVSQRFKDWAPKAGISNATFIPCDIDATCRWSTEPFFAMNVIGLLDRIDLDAGEYVPYKKARVARVRRLSLRPDETQTPIHRLLHYRLILVLRDDVAEALRSAGLTGAALRPADGWNDEHRF